MLVKYVGSFGRYQKWQCFMLGMLGFIIGFYAYDIVFAAAIPHHWCTIPDFNTTDSAHLSGEELKELFIPKEEKNGELVLSSCLLYDDIGFKNGSNEDRKTKKCSKWTYDRSVYKSTIVTEVILARFVVYEIFFTVDITYQFLVAISVEVLKLLLHLHKV